MPLYNPVSSIAVTVSSQYQPARVTRKRDKVTEEPSGRRSRAWLPSAPVAMSFVTLSPCHPVTLSSSNGDGDLAEDLVDQGLGAVARAALAVALEQQAVGQHGAGQALDVGRHDVVAPAQRSRGQGGAGP